VYCFTYNAKGRSFMGFGKGENGGNGGDPLQ
jgi:hypothetical protein